MGYDPSLVFSKLIKHFRKRLSDIILSREGAIHYMTQNM
jgi:hypothetical protein